VTGLIRSILLREWWDPARVFQALYAGDSHAFWLDAGNDASVGRSYLGAATPGSRFVTAFAADQTVHTVVPGNPAAAVQVSDQTIFSFLRDELAGARPTDDAADDGGFRLGWMGWLGYELGSQTVGTPVHPSPFPDAALLHVDRAVTFDHASRTVTLLAREDPSDDAGSIDAWVEHVEHTLRHSTISTPPEPAEVCSARWRHSPEQYALLIEGCLQAIRAGDAYQVCLTNEILVDTAPDPLAAYLRLRLDSPSHHGGFLRFGDTALLSASPEQFLQVSVDGRVRTKPIKGTRPRSLDAARDDDLARELEGSEKERAENLMIVDLMRNDLGRIAELGSVAVSSLLAVETYPHVHQLVSTIDAQLDVGLTGIDAVESCFPAGSMTGAPKQSAMGIIDRLEAGPRGVYAGAFGYFGLDGAVDLAIVIRSIVLGPNGASVGTGGGITALSDPGEEIIETQVKAAALLAALGVRGSALTKRGE